MSPKSSVLNILGRCPMFGSVSLYCTSPLWADSYKYRTMAENVYSFDFIYSLLQSELVVDFSINQIVLWQKD